MLPQHGGVPNFSMRIPAPALALLALVLLTGLMLSASFFLHADEGDPAALNHAKLCLIITVLLSIMILLAGTGRWWHAHLWQRRNSQKHHRHRHRHHHHSHHHRDF